MAARSIFLATALSVGLCGCAGTKPKPVELARTPPTPAKLSVAVPQGWLYRNSSTAEGLEAVELMRLDERGMLTAQAKVMRQPAANFDVPGTIRDVAKVIWNAGGHVVFGLDASKPLDRVAYTITQDGVELAGLIIFKQATGRPDELVAVQARWLASLNGEIRPEIDAIIGSADIK